MVNCSKNLSTVINTHSPPLDELQQVIEKALLGNFKTASAEITQCPDTSKPPFNTTTSGFGRNLRVAEVGGPGNIYPKVNKEKHFDLKEICEVCDLPQACVFGPGAGPWPEVGVNCEMVADANFETNKFAIKTAKIEDSAKGYKMEVFDTSKFSLMGNLAVSDSDKSSPVVHFKCSGRKGATNLPETIRQALAEKYEDKTVTLAGLFIIQEGKAKLHVMPDFPGCPWNDSGEVDKWLQYFVMSAPLVCATVFHSYDPGHKLRLEHTHCYSEHGDAGHYHYDVTPETVVYEGWLAPAEKIYRIDEV